MYQYKYQCEHCSFVTNSDIAIDRHDDYCIGLKRKQTKEILSPQKESSLSYPQNFGYHSTEIKKGIYGEISKIHEELAELADAKAQGNKILLLVEASDLLGAIEAFIIKESDGKITLQDLIKMSDATKAAFLSGSRVAK